MARIPLTQIMKQLAELIWKKYSNYIICLTATIVICIIIKDNWPKRLYRTYVNVEIWMENPTIGCEGNFEAYGEEFVVLHKTKLDKTSKYFSIPCEGKIPDYNFLYGVDGTVLQKRLENMKTMSHDDVAKYRVEKNLTIAILRVEAHNIYHTLCEWYNVLLLSKLLNFDPYTVDILFLDDRPKSPLDPAWDVLFGNVMRYSEIPDDVIYENLIWNVIGYESPLNFHWQYILPYADEFYRFLITAYKLPIKPLDCSNLTVRIIFRRDYNSHPERKNIAGGRVYRKFANEDEILASVKAYLPTSADVKAVILETMTIHEQIETFANTDIMMGMHGAGMAHAIFLPPHAVVFELFPRYWGQLQHYHAFSRWRGLRYIPWKNIDYRNERFWYRTYIPPLVFKLFVPELLEYLCPM